ncbi:MAG: 1-deoxy-D-xylulose-5-phosphate reductoisomerase [bacterium]|nr:1-deoxy-D-xylulose-5-phosphate reductoisomerase [bacterium]
MRPNQSTTRTVTVLGSTGSIGTQTLDILSRNKDRYFINFLTCNTRVELLAEQVRQYKPYGVAIRDEVLANRFKALCPEFAGPILSGEAGLCDAASHPDNDVVMSAMVGFSGVVPTMAAIRAGKIVGLANKETLVSAGEVMMQAAREHSATIVAVDSEHSAILQCLAGERIADVEKFIITASGGPFLTWDEEALRDVSVTQALNHPNWTMGPKITVDSATLMNKGFEVVEARWLFDADPSRIEVLVHPQSIVHSMVQFVDGSVKAQMGVPSMLVPIQYALTYPTRYYLDVGRVDFVALGTLTFAKPDLLRFPCLRIAYDVLHEGGSAPCVANAANEVAVDAFLKGRINFLRIPGLIEDTLTNMQRASRPSLDDIVGIDADARRIASEML